MPDQLTAQRPQIQLLKYARDWNTNTRYSLVVQRFLKVVFTMCTPARFERMKVRYDQMLHTHTKPDLCSLVYATLVCWRDRRVSLPLAVHGTPPGAHRQAPSALLYRRLCARRNAPRARTHCDVDHCSTGTDAAPCACAA